MDRLVDLGSKQFAGVANEGDNELISLLLREVQPKSGIYHVVNGICLHLWHVSTVQAVQHLLQRGAVSAKDLEHLARVDLHGDKHLSILTTHGSDHFVRDTHRRREWLRVSSQYEPEVNVEQAAMVIKEKVIQMAIANPEQIGDDAISSTAPDKVVHHGFILNPEGTFPLMSLRMFATSFPCDVAKVIIQLVLVLVQDGGQVSAIGNHFKKSSVRTGGDHAVGG